MNRERDGLLAALAVMLVLALGLVFSYRAQVVKFRHDYYTQCVDRVQYDASSQQARKVARDYWRGVIEEEKSNKFIDQALREKRVAGAQKMVDSLSDVLTKTVRGGCDQYRP